MYVMLTKKLLKVAIIGSGNIGTDLLVKIMRSQHLVCTLFTGRNYSSTGMKRAAELGIQTSDQGINAILSSPDVCDLVFDATSAHAHIEHWEALRKIGKTVIDMTPAKLGAFCIPAINAVDYGGGAFRISI